VMTILNEKHTIQNNQGIIIQGIYRE
jgi:hypothetical protein